MAAVIIGPKLSEVILYEMANKPSHRSGKRGYPQ
jgi:hypothetical protein